MKSLKTEPTKILTDSASFQLVRTNPKLTGNVKIMVNESGDMWLESIKANRELSKDLYSKVQIDTNQSHAANIFRFFNSGQTPNEIIFDISESVDSTKTSKDFKDQYDFSHYFSGAKYLASNKYSERMSYFAPLYLKKDTPSYFIVFKISGPANSSLDLIKEQYEAGLDRSLYLKELFSKASIIKTFSLGPETTVGKYIQKYTSDPNFPISPLSVNFKEGEFTTWNGILINEGTIGYRGELLSSLYSSSQPLKAFEENITNGFSRHGVLFPDILNFEFIFNDDQADLFEFNRYLGIYVNTIELTQLDLDLDRVWTDRFAWDNAERLRKNYLETDNVSLPQTNPNGVILPFKNSTINISEFKDIFKNPDNYYLTYINDKDDNLYIPKLNHGVEKNYSTAYPITISSNNSTATCELMNHQYSTGDYINIISPVSSLNGTFQITVINSNKFTYSVIDPTIFSQIFAQARKVISEVTVSPFQIDLGQTKLAQLTNPSGLLIQATIDLHGYSTDDVVVINSNDLDYSGEFLITVIDLNTFSYQVNLAPSSASASGTCRKEQDTFKFRFANTKIDLGKFFGQEKKIFLQDAGSVNIESAKSYSLITLNGNLNNYDEIKIYHPNGTQSDVNGRYELITATVNYPLIPLPGEYYAYLDYDGVLGHDQFYINSSGKLSEVTQALADCINSIRNRTFTAYNYDNHVFIKLNAAGDLDNDYRLSFYSPIGDYSVFEILGESGQITKSFVGGARKNSNRLIINSGHLEKLEKAGDSVFIKTSDSYSRIKKISNLVDEITETNSVTAQTRSKAIASYLNNISIILDELEVPAVKNNEFLMNLKFRSSFGLLSMFAIKDLDFDFYNSQYDNFPEIDLYQYYFVPPGVNLLEPGITYNLTNGTIKVGNLIIDPSNFTVATQTSYSINSGSPIVIFESSKTDNPLLPISDDNGELTDFPGFSILQDPSKIIQAGETEYDKKYLNGATSTEYDYYQENDSLDFATRSKIVPYITKWGLKNSTDTRGNKYRLNTELIFGRNNFSPDQVDAYQNPINFTHEWFYIESAFNYLNDDITLSKNNYYFETPFDYSGALLTDPNYFINYFTYTPTNNTDKEVGPAQFRYSTLTKNKAGQYEAFFKGFKIAFRDVTESNSVGADNKPLYRLDSDRFDGYRFSCILKPVKEEIDSNTQQPIKYRVIEHKGFKFIVIVIEVAIGELSAIDPYWYSSDKPLVTTGTDGRANDINDKITVPTDYLFNTINGDYRITFNSDNVSNLSHTLLYSLKHKKYQSIVNSFSNIKFGEKFNITSSGVIVNNANKTVTIRKIDTPQIDEYPSSISSDLAQPTPTTVIFYRDLRAGGNVFIDSRVRTSIPNSVLTDPINSILSSTYDNYAVFDITNEIPCLVRLKDNVTFDVVSMQLPYGVSSYLENNYVFKAFSAGRQYHERFLAKLSFANFKKLVNEQNNRTQYSAIEYYSYGEDNTLAIDPKFYIEILDIDTITKINQVISLDTDEIPTQFANQKSIGTEYEVTNLTRPYELNRYSGEYTPLVQEYSQFLSSFSFTKNNISTPVDLTNIKINTYNQTLLTIPNFSHIKIADSQILELEADDTYSPIYPKIGEIAIAQSPYFLFSGNWDWGFHRKYLNKFESEPVSGALRLEEDDSFISKLITLPETIRVMDFDKSNINQFYKIENETIDINTVDISNREIVIKETSTSVDGLINLNNTIIRYLITNGFINKFNEYLIASPEYIGNFNTINEYAKEYIRVNILKLYNIEVNEFYAKSSAAVSTGSTVNGANPNGIDFTFISDRDRFVQGYSIMKSLQINKKERLILKFSFTKPAGQGLLISPNIKINFI